MPDVPRLCRVAGRDAWHVYHERRRISTGTADRAEAERFLADFQAASLAPAPAGSISTILSSYLADRQARAIPGAERLRWAHKPLTAFFGDRPPSVVTEAECRAYVASRPVAASTVRTELQALRAALRWAKAEGVVTMPAKPPARDRWLTRAEADKLLASCRAPHVRLFVLVALHTAARRSAVLGLTWDRVDLELRRITYKDPTVAATRKGRAVVPITDTLLPALLEARGKAVTPFVVEYGGERVASVKHGFKDACARAGLVGVKPHTLRHTAATWMAQAGVALWQVAGFLGHSDVRMVSEVYGHHSPDHMADAARALG